MHISDIKVGVRLWHVCGMWPPYVTFAGKVSSLPVEAMCHSKYRGIKAPLDLALVFGVEKDGVESVRFANDGNLMAGGSGNNFWFASDADAASAVRYIHEEYIKNEAEIIKEEEKTQVLCEFYTLF